MRILLIALLLLGQAAAPQFPQAQIASDGIRATLYLPDGKTGYYRGTRFDWSGVISSLQWNGHEYFGPWFERHDPHGHDGITGPVEEFQTGGAGLGYDEVKAGESFVKIGVGAIRKPDEPAFRRFATYEIVDPGKWTVDKGTDWIEFTHELRDTAGYAYVYRKRLSLGKNTLVLDHQLRNTGRKTITTNVYNHNFFTLDRQPTGPDFRVQFPFELRAPGDLKGLGEARGREVVFLQPFARTQTMFTELYGFGDVKDYDIRVENRNSRAGVRITGDKPISKLVFWAAGMTVCPEPYIDMAIEPGKDFSWRLTYDFYEVRS